MSAPTLTSCQVELFLVTLGDDSVIHFIRRHAPLHGTPDDAARALLATSKTVWLHSTSWRFENGDVVLTYLAWCEWGDWCNDPDMKCLSDRSSVSHQCQPYNPSPLCVTESHVLTHGLRHFSWLAQRPEENPCVHQLDERTQSWLKSLEAFPAGQIRGSTHIA